MIHSPPYVFIVGAILYILIHQHKNIKGITINGTEYVLAQYADGTEFLLDEGYASLQAALDTLDYFCKISGLKMNIENTRTI